MDTIQFIFQTFHNYSDSSCLMALALIALLYLWLTEEDRSLRCGLIYLSVAMFTIFFIPIYGYVVMHLVLEQAVYYRMLWYVPVSVLIAYAVIRVVIRAKSVRRRVVTVLASLFIVVACGSCVFTDGTYVKAENKYHLPQYVIDVADVLHRDSTRVNATLPPEFVQFIRQYDTQINLVYGRDSLVQGWGNDDTLYDLMVAPTYDIQSIQYYTRKWGGLSIVLDSRRPYSRPMEDFHFTCVATVENYEVYIYDEFIEACYPEYQYLLPETAE